MIAEIIEYLDGLFLYKEIKKTRLLTKNRLKILKKVLRKVDGEGVIYSAEKPKNHMPA